MQTRNVNTTILGFGCRSGRWFSGRWCGGAVVLVSAKLYRRTTQVTAPAASSGYDCGQGNSREILGYNG
ncbi:hypothetical protein ACLKA6_000124 [Drosophila palustris]